MLTAGAVKPFPGGHNYVGGVSHDPLVPGRIGIAIGLSTPGLAGNRVAVRFSRRPGPVVEDAHHHTGHLLSGLARHDLGRLGRRFVGIDHHVARRVNDLTDVVGRVHGPVVGKRRVGLGQLLR